MIKIENVSLSFEGKTVLDGISLNVKQGEFLCVTGPSGSGKTSLLRVAAGLEKPDSGSCAVNGTLCICFQENRLLPLSALENMKAVGIKTEKAVEYLKKAEMEKDLHKHPSELSGGMRRRLALVRCLAMERDVYFLDEPLRELDADTRDRMRELIKTELSGKTVFMISHNAEDVEYFGAAEYKM